MPNCSLLKWLATFQLDGRAAVELEDDAYYNLADGFISARILNQISPQYFSNSWLDGIRPVPPNGSWRLRVSNLKRILQKIHDYASDLQSPQFEPNAITPDVAVIAQNFDSDQINRLIQLILFCAINSDKKQDYIEKIRDLPTQVKQDIKEAIEELLVKDPNASQSKLQTSHVGNESVNSEIDSDIVGSSNMAISSHALTSPSRTVVNRNILRRDSSQASHESPRKNEINSVTNFNDSTESVEELRQKLNTALIIKDERAQACHELETRLKQLQLEKEQLALENERLTCEKNSPKLTSSPIKHSELRRNSQAGRSVDINLDIENRLSNLEDESSRLAILHQNKKLQAELSNLKEEILRIETEKEDYRLKSNLLKEDLDKITSKHDELRSKAERAKRLQDELDEHKQISEKVASYETMIDNLVKKNNEMKKELKRAEEKNSAHIHNIVRLEEENSRLISSVNSSGIYKRQLQEVQVRLSQETHRADKAEFELTRLSEKFDSTKGENEKLYETISRLMRGGNAEKLSPNAVDPQVKDFNLIESRTKFDNEPRLGGDGEDQGEKLGSLQVSMSELKEKIVRLEYENELLQNKLDRRENDQDPLRDLLDIANSRCAKLESENRQARKKILLLESRLSDVVNPQNGATAGAFHQNESNSDNTDLLNRIEELRRILFQKDQELADFEAKYNRNLQKARDVISRLNENQPISQSLHASCMSSTSSFNSSSLDEINTLKRQLREREEKLIEIEREFYEYKKFKEVHERLIISAFYGIVSTSVEQIQ